MKLIPPKLTPTDVARIYREVFGGSRHDETVRLFAEAVQSAINAKWLEMLEGQEASAYRVDWPIEAGLGLPRFFGADDRERMDLFVNGPYEPAVTKLYAAPVPAKAPRFEKVYCSQCGGSFGAGDAGFSHCTDHHGITDGGEG